MKDLDVIEYRVLITIGVLFGILGILGLFAINKYVWIPLFGDESLVMLHAMGILASLAGIWVLTLVGYMIWLFVQWISGNEIE